VRAYSASSEEALRARDMLKDWAGEDFLTAEQYQRLEQETACDLRCTNVFLRLVLFLFTLVIIGAAVALFFIIFVSHPSDQTAGFFLLIFAALTYGAAEIAVSQARLYRYGIEEALAVCSVGFLCVGMQAAFVSGHSYSTLVPAGGAVLSLWIWHRFGFPYAALAAMIFLAWLPGHWTSSPSAQHLIVAGLYAGALATLAAVRPHDRSTYLDREYSIAEALLWIGIYLAINLQLSPLPLRDLWRSTHLTTDEFSSVFYWTTWVLTWCLPAVVLIRGLRRKDRFVIAAGALAAVLTLVTNKLYVGGKHHTWDPMLLGALLLGVAIFVRRWLANGQGGIRHGFTAERLSGKDKSWLSAGVATFGFLSPHMATPSPQSDSPEVHFGGGDSGGAGASSDF